MIRNRSQWVIADVRGERCEGAYETEAQARVALTRLEYAARRRQHEAEWRKKIGQAFCTDDWDLNAIQHFKERVYRVVEEPLNNSVYRLNADIADDADFLNEVLWKLRLCGEVEIHWTCTGHTRAECQGAATANFLKHFGYEAECWGGGSVSVKAKKAVR